MNVDERRVHRYLISLGLGEVEFEPDGNVPPDFLVGGVIAVEARRLNQHYDSVEGVRSLEQDSIPLVHGIGKLLAETRVPDLVGSWFVLFNYRRPLLPWRQLRPKIRDALRAFARSPIHETWRVTVAPDFNITFHPSSQLYESTFVIGGYTDFDAGGWIVSEVIRNLSVYAMEKAGKIEAYRSKYGQWWLVLVDHIDHAQHEEEVKLHFVPCGSWDRIVLLSPLDDRAYAI